MTQPNDKDRDSSLWHNARRPYRDRRGQTDRDAWDYRGPYGYEQKDRPGGDYDYDRVNYEREPEGGHRPSSRTGSFEPGERRESHRYDERRESHREPGHLDPRLDYSHRDYDHGTYGVRYGEGSVERDVGRETGYGYGRDERTADDEDFRYERYGAEYDRASDRDSYTGGYGRFGHKGGEFSETSQKYRGVGPKGYERSPERIRDEVCERLADHGLIDATDVEVTVERCEVTLEGHVADRRQKRLAEDVAERVSGVRDVHNRLRVGSAASPEPSAARPVANEAEDAREPPHQSAS